MTAAELQALLAPHGIRPIKGRSQHFLLDDRVVERMCAVAGVGPGTPVLEIGPGPGILTEALLRRGAKVVAAELDLKLQELLAARFGHEAGFTLIRGDALSVANSEYARLLKRESADSDYVIVANLPYAITSAVLQKFLLEDEAPSRLVIMIQKEVADRINAKPGEMSSLAVMAQVFAEISKICDVPPGAFLPPPRVDSAVVQLIRRSDAEIKRLLGPGGREAFFSLTQAAFKAPRKQLKNTLRALATDDKLEAAFRSAAIDPSARPERLSVQDWSRLARALHG